MRSLLRAFLLCAVVALSFGCKSKPTTQTVPQPGAVPQPGVPAPAPQPGGVTMSSGGSKTGASLNGIAGQRTGNEVVVTTTDTTLPPVGASGPLMWIVDRPIPVFGQGVQLQIANVQVK